MFHVERQTLLHPRTVHKIRFVRKYVHFPLDHACLKMFHVEHWDGFSVSSKPLCFVQGFQTGAATDRVGKELETGAMTAG